MRFRDRAHAGRELARRLAGTSAGAGVVGAIPRGGVVVGRPVAEALGAALVVVNAHKLTAPIAPEFAFGALDEDGEILLDRTAVQDLGLDAADVADVRRLTWEAMRARLERQGSARLIRWLPGEVVLVDDGLATGLTMLAAVRYARRHGAGPITVAAPCASRQAADALRLEAERFVCPVVDPGFAAVGCYYEDFAQVSDAEVAGLLRAARGRGSGAEDVTG